MKLLLDECVDWRLLREFADHDAQTVKQVGWENVKNGALLRLAATKFDVFMTVDKNLPHQQNLAGLELAALVLRGRTTRLPDLLELLPMIRAALLNPQPGKFQIISWRDLA
jgi:predicted nuclease of predicted toxin-antitoxin system